MANEEDTLRKSIRKIQQYAKEWLATPDASTANIRLRAYNLLIKRLAKDPSFQSVVDALRRDFPEMRQWRSFASIWDGSYNIPPEKRGQYINGLISLAGRFNLQLKDPGWVCDFPILTALHDYIFFEEDTKSLDWFPEGEPIGSVVFTFRDGWQHEEDIYPNTRFDQVILAAKIAWEHLKPLETYRPRLKSPKQLERDIDWAYQHVVLGKTPQQIHKGLPQIESCSESTVRRSLKYWVKLLDLKPRRGRPRKRKKR